MQPHSLLVVALLTHTLAMVTAAILARRPAWCRWASFGGAGVASSLVAVLAIRALIAGGDTHGVLLTHAASGFSLTVAVDGLSAWFLLVLGLVAVPVSIYSIGYMAHAIPARRTAMVGIAFNVVLAAVTVVLVADSVVGFVFAWEVMSLATVALVATEHEQPASRRAAYLYLVMSHVGTGCLIAAFLMLASAAGSVSFGAILSGNVVQGSTRTAVFWLFFLGFGVKAGILPLHIWLPEAHPAAPSSVSAFMSGVLITTGVYGLMRCCTFGLGVPDASWGLTFLILGAVTAILGVLYALAQHDLKRLLAYSTIEHAGIILLGLGAAMMALSRGRRDLAVIGVAASLYHVLNHAAFKGLLFLGTGGVVMATGSRDLESFGGLMRRMPWTGACFLIGALAISGVPPLNGFVSEWLTFQALLLDFTSIPGLVRLNFPAAGALLALTSALAAACFVKAFGITFLARPRSPGAAQANESPVIMLVPQLGLALVCLGLGVFPGAVLVRLQVVLASLPGLQGASPIARGGLALSAGTPALDVVMPLALGGALVGSLALARLLLVGRRGTVRRTATWGCGGELTPQTEYTGTAFSKPLVMMFSAIYRPTREVEALAHGSPYYPHAVRYRANIEPTFERYLYVPLTRAILWVAERMKILQAGSLHAYLAYILVLGVGLLIWLGGTR